MLLKLDLETVLKTLYIQLFLFFRKTNTSRFYLKIKSQ